MYEIQLYKISKIIIKWVIVEIEYISKTFINNDVAKQNIQSDLFSLN